MNLSQTEKVYMIKSTDGIIIYDERTHPNSFFFNNEEREYSCKEMAFYNFQLFSSNREIINFDHKTLNINKNIGEISFVGNSPTFNIGPTLIFPNDHLLTFLFRMREVFNLLADFPEYKRRIMLGETPKFDHIGFLVKNFGLESISFFVLRKTLKGNVHTFHPDIPTIKPFLNFNYISDKYDWIIDEYEFLTHINSYVSKPKYLMVQMVNQPPLSHDVYTLKAFFNEHGRYNEISASGDIVQFSSNGLSFEKSSMKFNHPTFCLYTQGSLYNFEIPEKQTRVSTGQILNPFKFYRPAHQKNIYLKNLISNEHYPLYIQQVPSGTMVILYTMRGKYFAYSITGANIEIDEKNFDDGWNFFLQNSFYIEAVLTCKKLEIIFYIHLDEINEEIVDGKNIVSSEKNFSMMRTSIPGHIIINNIEELVKFKNLSYRIYRPHSKYIFDQISIEILSPIMEISAKNFIIDGQHRVKILIGSDEKIISPNSISGKSLDPQREDSFKLYSNTYETLGGLIQPVYLS